MSDGINYKGFTIVPVQIDMDTVVWTCKVWHHRDPLQADSQDALVEVIDAACKYVRDYDFAAIKMMNTTDKSWAYEDDAE